MDVTKPIPATRIVNVIEDAMCLEVTCLDLPSVMQAVVAKLCNTDLPSLDFGCLTPVVTERDFYQLIIDKICIDDSVVIIPHVYELCMVDGWDCSDVCLTVTNPCGDITQEDVIQAMITRINDYSTVLCDLQTRVGNLENENESLQLQITALENCCP